MFTWKQVEKACLVATLCGVPIGLVQCYLAVRSDTSQAVITSSSPGPQSVSVSSRSVAASTVVINQGIQSAPSSLDKSSGDVGMGVVNLNDNPEDARLVISGSGNHVRIMAGAPGGFYQGGTVSGSGTDATIHLPVGQHLSIETIGSGTDIEIEKKIMRYVDIVGTGAGTDVSEI